MLKAFLCTEGLSPAKRYGLCPAWRPGVSREGCRVDMPFWKTVWEGLVSRVLEVLWEWHHHFGDSSVVQSILQTERNLNAAWVMLNRAEEAVGRGCLRKPGHLPSPGPTGGPASHQEMTTFMRSQGSSTWNTALQLHRYRNSVMRRVPADPKPQSESETGPEFRSWSPTSPHVLALST